MSSALHPLLQPLQNGLQSEVIVGRPKPAVGDMRSELHVVGPSWPLPPGARRRHSYLRAARERVAGVGFLGELVPDVLVMTSAEVREESDFDLRNGDV